MELVGRVGDIALAIESLDAPRRPHVLLVGPPGTGATTSMHHIADEVARRGRTVLTPNDDTLARLVAAPHTHGDVLGAQIVDARDAIVVVDDLGNLSANATAAIERLTSERIVQLLASIRRSGPSMPRIAGMLSRRVDVEWIELAPFTIDQVDELVSKALGGPLDRSSLHALYELTGGNQGRITTLVPSAPVTHGPSLTNFFEIDGLWRLDMTGATAMLRSDELTRRWATVNTTTNARQVIGLVARLGDVPLGLLLAHFEPPAIIEAERSSIIESVVTGSGVPTPDRVCVRLGDPLDASSICAALTPAEQDTVDRAIMSIDASPLPGLLAARADVLTRRPSLHLDDVDVIVAAASAAADRSEPAMALALVDAIVGNRIDPSRHGSQQRWDDQRARAALIAAKGLDRLGRNEEALVVLERAAAFSSDELIQARIAIQRSMVLARFNDANALASLDAVDAVTPAVRDVIDVQRASLLLHAGRTDEALSVVEAAAAHPHDLLGEAIVVLGPGLAVSGRPRRGLRLVAAARAALGADTTPLQVSDSSMLDIIEAVCLAESGDVVEAERLAATRYAGAVEAGDRWRQAWYALHLGRVDLLTGSCEAALRSFVEAAVAFADVDHPGYRAWALAGAAGAAARVGDAGLAVARADAYDHAGPHDVRLFEPEGERLRAGVDLLIGNEAAAMLRLERALAAASASGQRAPELAIAFDLVLAGRPLGEPTIRAVRDYELDGGLTRTRRAFVLSASAGRRDDLIAIAIRFGALGCQALALDVWCYAAREFACAGSEAERRLCVRSASRLVRDGVHGHPGLHETIVAPCSRRELEVAVLAAGGSERREIATSLFISPRTVDRHLNAAFAKLGVSSRGELADALASHPDAQR